MSEEKGHFRCYVERRFSQDSLDIIGRANDIIAEYQAQGLGLTLRQLYYQFVARGLLPNVEANYNKLGGLISDGRLAGLVSWMAISDPTRYLRGVRTFRSPKEIVENAAKSYRRDLWEGQAWRPEVWVEKEALASVVEGICGELRVDFFACRGYASQSSQWEAGERLAGYVRRGQRPIIFHLGDHDPSGIDMTRDVRDRLSMFVGVPVLVQRLALNMPQIEQYNPPPNPAKVTDSRYESYQRDYGDESWELDALPPTAIRDLIENAIMLIREEKAWSAALAEEADGRDDLARIVEEL